MATTDVDPVLECIVHRRCEIAFEIADDLSGITLCEAQESPAPTPKIGLKTARFVRSSAAVGMRDACNTAIVGRLSVFELLNGVEVRALPDLSDSLIMQVCEQVFP